MQIHNNVDVWRLPTTKQNFVWKWPKLSLAKMLEDRECSFSQFDKVLQLTTKAAFRRATVDRLVHCEQEAFVDERL